MKFLDTNITVENFISSLKKTKEELPKVISDWKNLDEELQIEYLDQLGWMLTKTVEYMEKKESFGCEGCGEPRYKCYCDEDCPYCKKKLIACIGESDSGWCSLDPNIEKYLEFQRSINKKS